MAGVFGAHVGGTISFELYDNNSCEGAPVASDGPVAVSANGEYESPHGASPTASGTYYWVATYSGDANNKAAVSGCADEPVAISQAPPSIATTQNPTTGTVAAPHGPQACVAQTTPVYVTGRQIVSATFYLDGRKVKKMTKADKRGRYGIKVKAGKLRFGVHRVKVIVVFAPGSETKPQTLSVL